YAIRSPVDEGHARHRPIAAQAHQTGITPPHGRNLAKATHGGNSLGEGRADRSAPTEAMASRQGRRGAGFLELIPTPGDRESMGRWKAFARSQLPQWPRGDSNSHVLSDIGS